MFNFDEATRKGKEVMEGMLKSYADITKGFQAITDESAAYSRKSYQNGLAHFEALSSAKSPEAVFDLQVSFLRASYETAIAEATRIGSLYADLGKVTYKPFEAAPAKATAKASQAAALTIDAVAEANPASAA